MTHCTKMALAVAILIAACGGGSVDDGTSLAAWEIEPGVCSFSNVESYKTAVSLGAQCLVILIGNTMDGESTPKFAWSG